MLPHRWLLLAASVAAAGETNVSLGGVKGLFIYYVSTFWGQLCKHMVSIACCHNRLYL